MESPRQIKIAIVLSWTVLLIQTAERVWRIALDPEAAEKLTFRLSWFFVTLGASFAIAVFIYAASRQRNWGRILLLICTLGAWSLWFVYPRQITDYLVWQWLVYGALTAMELAAILLLFFGKGGQWFSSGRTA